MQSNVKALYQEVNQKKHTKKSDNNPKMRNTNKLGTLKEKQK